MREKIGRVVVYILSGGIFGWFMSNVFDGHIFWISTGAAFGLFSGLRDWHTGELTSRTTEVDNITENIFFWVFIGGIDGVVIGSIIGGVIGGVIGGIAGILLMALAFWK